MPNLHQKKAANLRFLPQGSGRRARYARFLRGAVACLPPRQRQTAQLCLLRGYTLRRAAQELGVSESTASRRLQAAIGQLERMAELFQQLEEDREP